MLNNNNNTEFRYKQLQDFKTEVNWNRLVKKVAHKYVESGIGRLKVPVESMIRVYFLQRRYQLSAIEVSLALSSIDALREFTLIDLSIDILPEEESIGEFSLLIKKSGLFSEFKSEFNLQANIDTII